MEKERYKVKRIGAGAVTYGKLPLTDQERLDRKRSYFFKDNGQPKKEFMMCYKDGKYTCCKSGCVFYENKDCDEGGLMWQ